MVAHSPSTTSGQVWLRPLLARLLAGSSAEGGLRGGYTENGHNYSGASTFVCASQVGCLPAFRGNHPS